MKVAAVYIRVSTDDQTELSPDSQLEMLRTYAKQHDILIPEDLIFIDGGISGRSAKNRPEFNRMIGNAKREDHPFDTLLLWKFSRFARNQEESIFYKSMLRKSGVEVVSISEPLIEGPFGSLIERIIEWMDEYYSIRLSGEVKRSMTVNAERGARQTIAPFGYRTNPGGKPSMLVHPDEAEIIRECFRRYTDGEAVWKLVDDLNSRGIRSHRGGAIENRTVTYWLRNPAYIGKNRWTPTGRIRRDFDNPDTLIVDGDHEPLISRELFDAAQQRLDAMSLQFSPKSRPSYELKDWLGGIVRCSECGSTLILQTTPYTRKDGSKSLWQHFVCNGYVHRKCRTNQSVKPDALHDAMISILSHDLDPLVPLDYTVSRNSSRDAERASLEQQLTALNRKLFRVREAYTAGVDSLEEYRRNKEEIDSDIAAVYEKINSLTAPDDPISIADALRERIRHILETLQSPDIPLTDKNESLKDLIDTCVWNKQTSTLSITYRVIL